MGKGRDITCKGEGRAHEGKGPMLLIEVPASARKRKRRGKRAKGDRRDIIRENKTANWSIKSQHSKAFIRASVRLGGGNSLGDGGKENRTAPG